MKEYIFKRTLEHLIVEANYHRRDVLSRVAKSGTGQIFELLPLIIITQNSRNINYNGYKYTKGHLRIEIEQEILFYMEYVCKVDEDWQQGMENVYKEALVTLINFGSDKLLEDKKNRKK